VQVPEICNQVPLMYQVLLGGISMKENFMNFYSKNWDHRVADQKLLDYGIDLSTDFGEVILMTVLLGQNVRDVVMQNPV